MKPSQIDKSFEEIRRQLERLPDTEEPPPTTLQVLSRGRREGDWQRFLAYFLTPEAPHGLGHSALEQFLQGLRGRDDVDFDFSRFDLSEVEIATEVPIPDGRLDLLVWSEEWFVLCELKVDSSERDGQTLRYACADTFENVALDPTDIPETRRHYLYITPDRSQPESCEFTAIGWAWVASQLRSVQASDYGSFPARTTGQLDDFVDTIETELTMTEHDRNETAKAGLYTDYYDVISEVEGAFESEWNDLINNWGRRLATTLDGARLVEDPEGVPDVSDEDVMIELPDGENRRRYWVCRQANGNWSWLFPTDWWTNLETGEPIYRNEGSNARVGFLHRPDSDRDTILEDHTLTFYLRNAPSGNDNFYPRFQERFNDDTEIGDSLPENTERRGVKSNVLEVTYNIDVDEHGDLFTAYIDALSTAVDDHIVSNHSLVRQIDELYEETYNDVFDGNIDVE